MGSPQLSLTQDESVVVFTVDMQKAQLPDSRIPPNLPLLVARPTPALVLVRKPREANPLPICAPSPDQYSTLVAQVKRNPCLPLERARAERDLKRNYGTRTFVSVIMTNACANARFPNANAEQRQTQCVCTML